jgi:hypothetical protein
MADSLVPVTELGFAEFTSGLISQTLEAVISAYADQERKLLELRRACALTPEAYAVQFEANLALDEELARRFPPPDASLTSAVHPGASYTPAAAGQVESPAIEQLTGYRMTNRDYRKQPQGYVLLNSGYTNVRRTVALELAKAQLLLLQNMAAKGFPKVLVDNGRISSKLVFKLYQEQAAPASPSPGRLPALSTGIASLAKLMVTPVHARGPEYLSVQADIVGEVEVTFKTITD